MLGKRYKQRSVYDYLPLSIVQRILFRCAYAAGICVVLTIMVLPTPLLALGVGAAEATSFIGQRLSVRIPLFNVANPNSLQIEFNSEQFGGNNQVNVSAALDRANSQLAIKLISDKVVNEPYLNFSLSLVDGNTEFAKDFSVLLDLSPQGLVSEPQSLNQNLQDVNVSEAQANGTSGLTASNETIIGSTMGPYDTAVAGKIPERFGAVLDGQSLWRVARRINSAMSVSRDQMMWALYQANPDAFATSSVESLRAGSYLTIPSAEMVAQVSDSQAKAKLKALSNSALPRSPAGSKIAEFASQEVNSKQVPSDNSVVTEAAENLGSDQEKSSQGPFQVTTIGQSVGDQSSQAQSQVIIASLTETVGNMSQQLERKDKKIEFLEEQVEELKSFIKTGELSPLVELASNLPEADLNQIVEKQTESSVAVISESKNIIEKQADQSLFQTFLPWVLIALLILAFVIYAAWERIQQLIYSLNLFGRQDNMEFSVAEPQIRVSTEQVTEQVAEQVTELPYRVPDVGIEDSFGMDDSFEEGSISVYSTSNEDDGFHEEDSISFEGSYEDGISNGVTPNIEVPNFNSANTIEFGSQGYSNNSDEKTRVVKQPPPTKSFDSPYDENEMVETIELLADEISARESDDHLTFEQRFDRLLREEDYVFARELLDFARYNEINDERYHYERLRMLEKMGNEDTFYQYYYSIEEKINSFPPNIQTGISELVVRIAHV